MQHNSIVVSCRDPQAFLVLRHMTKAGAKNAMSSISNIIPSDPVPKQASSGPLNQRTGESSPMISPH